MNADQIISQFIGAVDKGANPIAQEQLINEEKPYGLKYGDLLHSQIVARSVGGFQGKRVLELGGCLPPDYVFKYLNPSFWVSVEYDLYSHNQCQVEGVIPESVADKYNNYRYTECGWNKFYKDWKYHLSPRFERIYSIAAFEHIDDLGECLQACYEMLEMGGVLYSYFTPIWSAPNGSHAMHPQEIEAKGDYSHLMYNFVSLQEFLVGVGCDPMYALKSAEKLYRSPQINRYTFEEFVAIFNSVPYREKKVVPINLRLFSEACDPQKLSVINKLYPAMKHSCDGFQLAMVK